MDEQRGPRYYGPLYWLGIAAFAAPILVAVFAFQSASRPLSKPVPNPGPDHVDHGLWDYLLKTWVENGQVDYAGMAGDHLLQVYIAELGASGSNSLALENERLAFLLNAYNAFVVHSVIIHRIEDSVREYQGSKRGFFESKEHILSHQSVSLDWIENRLIRRWFDDPRVHFALAIGARSCPSLRSEAYTPDAVETQLEDQARLFINDPKHVSYDPETKTLHLNAIFEWYGEEFEKTGGYLAFLKERAEEPQLVEGIERAIQGEAQVVFMEFDWGLNALSLPPARSPSGSEFGPGSVPNG